jgi:hypothetical protein
MPKAAISQDEHQLIKLVEKMRVPEEDKKRWIEQIRSGEMSEDLAAEIRHKLNENPEGTAADAQYTALRTRHLSELALLVKRWRLTNQSAHFGRK